MKKQILLILLSTLTVSSLKTCERPESNTSWVPLLTTAAVTYMALRIPVAVQESARKKDHRLQPAKPGLLPTVPNNPYIEASDSALPNLRYNIPFLLIGMPFANAFLQHSRMHGYSPRLSAHIALGLGVFPYFIMCSAPILKAKTQVKMNLYRDQYLRANPITYGEQVRRNGAWAQLSAHEADLILTAEEQQNRDYVIATTARHTAVKAQVAPFLQRNDQGIDDLIAQYVAFPASAAPVEWQKGNPVD